MLAAIDRDENTAREYDVERAMELVTLKLVGYTEVVHALLPRAPRRRVDPALRRPAKDAAVPGLDDRHAPSTGA